ncbi:ABC transporter ATP-binding protein [Penaeicola halotolerans]|uniref:ABC transporter ATP-binding protein n=1 Tax=Penaeicola halotolerans TaxID=2793196 RepID=UPI001CF8F799|nr:ABC transporter ATP-binding protein [Penaeicola halotolerans]
MAILVLDKISKKYSNSKDFAIREVSFEVPQGEILALVGESGSGKTTLLRLIAGLEHPDEGQITLAGLTVAKGSMSIPANKRKVGMVFQDYALFPHLTVLENVKFGLQKLSRSEKEKVAQETLELVGLKENIDKYPHELSGGQQQRVALARALAPRPDIILLDEPFSNLDTLLKDQVREDIRQIIKRFGITAVFVTHDTKDALSTADRIAILHKGRLQQVDIPRILYEIPANGYVANFFGKMNFMPGRPTDDGFYTPFGFLQCEQAKGKDHKYHIRFRPEHAFILDNSPDHLQGQIEKVAYLGDHQLLRVRSMDPEEKPAYVYVKTIPGKFWKEGTVIQFGLSSFHMEEEP